VFMASAIAQEANPKTWDILLTTPLSTAQIVLGNLLGRLFFVLSLLFASLPLFAITQYFGGVPGRAILASYAVAGCAALLVGAIAVSLSVSRLAGRRAVFAFYIAVVSYLGLTAALDAWLRLAGMGVGGAGVTSMTALNPFLALRALLNPSSYPVAAPGTFVGPKAWLLEHPVWTFCLGSVVISGLLIAASSLTVRLGGLAWIGSGDGGTPRRVDTDDRGFDLVVVTHLAECFDDGGAADGVVVLALHLRRHDQVGHAADRGGAEQRIAVAPDDRDVGEGVDESVDPPHVRRRLEQPALTGALPVEHLEDVPVIGVHAAQVLLPVPRGVRFEHHLEPHLHAVQGEGVDQDAFLGGIGAGEVNLGELGVALASLGEARLELVAPRIGLAGR